MNGLTCRFVKKQNGLTLIELIISIAISALLVGVIAFTLKMCLDTFGYVQEDVYLQQVLDETLQIIAEGDYEADGIKDSLEIVKAGSTELVFVPLWIDDSHAIYNSQEQKRFYVLNRPFKPGASVPLAEVLNVSSRESTWETIPINFYLDEKRDNYKSVQDKIVLNNKVPSGRKLRFIYQPDATHFPDVTWQIQFADKKISRIYRNKETIVPWQTVGRIDIKDLHFHYYDNSNTEIQLKGDEVVPQDMLVTISAVKVDLIVQGPNHERSGSVFVNIRRSRQSTSGLIIRTGTKMPIPNSKNIRVFALGNVIGVKEGRHLILDATSDTGRSWRLDIEFGFDKDVPVYKRYTVQFPVGQTVYSEEINRSTEQALNFLTLDPIGRYDYDVEPDTHNAVELTGNVELKVTRMDVIGASLFIRP